MSAANDSAYQYTKIGADAERAAKKAAEDNLPVDMMNDRRMRSYAGLWAIIGAKAAATVVLAEAREQFEQDIAEVEKRGALSVLTTLDDALETEHADGSGESLTELIAATLARAEKRGAVKALRMVDDRLLTERDELRSVRARNNWPMGVEDAARTVRSLADRIESGEVTLP